MPATVDLGSHDNRELFPDPPNVLSRPRIRKRTTRLAPHPKWSPTRAQILHEAGSTAKAVLLNISDTGFDTPRPPHQGNDQDQMLLQHHLSCGYRHCIMPKLQPPPP